MFKNKPLVSVCSITYNHENYIKDAIESFLMQKTDFDIEIIIHDDASSDKTPQIIKEYEEKYPDIIKPIYQQENQWSKGIRPSATYVWPKAKGKYIALCEGDDFWSDPMKLQKQVSLLERSENVVLVSNKTKEINFRKNKDTIFPEKGDSYLSKWHIIKGGAAIPTNGILVKSELLKNLPSWFVNFPVGDEAILILALYSGKVFVMDDIMSVYRKEIEGSWTKTQKDDLHLKIQTHLRFVKSYFYLFKKLKHPVFFIKMVQRIYRILKDSIKFIIT